MKDPLGGWGTYGSCPVWPLPTVAAWMPFRAPFAVGGCAGAGEPWAWACVVWAGEFCDENLELMLDIQEFLRDVGLESEEKLGVFSALPRLSNGGRLVGVFCMGGFAVGDGEVSEGCGGWMASSVPLLSLSAGCGGEGPPCAGVAGTFSESEDGATAPSERCVESVAASARTAPKRVPQRTVPACRDGAEVGVRRCEPLVE